MAEFLDHLKSISTEEMTAAAKEFDENMFLEDVMNTGTLRDPNSTGYYFGRIKEAGAALPMLGDVVAGLIRDWQFDPWPEEEHELWAFTCGVDMAIAVLWRVAARQQAGHEPLAEGP